MAERLIKIPSKGLHWTQQYAKPGDRIKVYPLLGGAPYLATVTNVNRNKYGRISYQTDMKLVVTEELTPRLHKGVTR